MSQQVAFVLANAAPVLVIVLLFLLRPEERPFGPRDNRWKS